MSAAGTDVFGDARSSLSFQSNGNDDGEKKKGFPVWGYIVLGAISTWLFTMWFKDYQNKDKQSKPKYKSSKPESANGTAGSSARASRKSSMKTPTDGGKRSGGKEGSAATAEAVIVPSSVRDEVEKVASAFNDGPETGMEGFAPCDSNDALQGASIDYAFQPFDDGESATAKPKSKVVVAESFNMAPHKNKNGMPAVTKQGLQEQKLRSLSRWSKQDKMPEFQRKYSNRSDRPPPKYKNLHKFNTGTCGRIDRDIFNVDPATVYVDDSNMDSKFGKAYQK